MWRGAFTVPAGSWEFKVALDGGWTVNYGDHATLDGPNLTLDLATPTTVSFYYSDATHWVTASLPSPSSPQRAASSRGWSPGRLGTRLPALVAAGPRRGRTGPPRRRPAYPPGPMRPEVAAGESSGRQLKPRRGTGGANIPFTVALATDTVTMSFSTTTHVLTVSVTSGLPTLDNDVWWRAYAPRDSRDTLYRTPGGVVPAGTPVTLRLRTYHDDVSAVKVALLGQCRRRPDPPDAAEGLRRSSGVSCYQQTAYPCDFWAYQVTSATPDNLWYRFLVTDGTTTVYYRGRRPPSTAGSAR